MKTKFFSRTLSLILALIMVLGMVPLAALATDAEAAAQAEATAMAVPCLAELPSCWARDSGELAL